jgi:3-hydroxyisobutyrate dehydrogenase-like beta-hydroxyacid dehydrogenase
MEIGLVGLGSIGMAVANNLCRAGHIVCGWNRGKVPNSILRAAGGRVATNPEEVFDASEIVISALSDDSAVEEIFLGSGLLNRIPRDSVHVCMATISVRCASALERAHRERGHAFVSAPVLGNSTQAIAGKINIVAAGDPATLHRITPVLEAVCQKVWLFGAVAHHANVAKIATNFLLGSAVEALGEALALIQKNGLDAEEYMTLVGNTAFSAPAYRMYGDKIIHEAFVPSAFKLSLATRDLTLFQSLANSSGLELPLADATLQRLEDAMAEGLGDHDLSALSRLSLRVR